jgi:hypothetical protein
MEFDANTAVTIKPKFVKIKVWFYKDHPMAWRNGLYDLNEK